MLLFTLQKLLEYNQGPISRKFQEFFMPEKPAVKLQSTCFEKLILEYVFNVRKTKRIAKFDGLEPWPCKHIKGIVASEIGPKSFGTFEKQASAHELFSFQQYVILIGYYLTGRRFADVSNLHID